MLNTSMRLCPGQSVKKNMRKMDGGDATEMTFYSQVHCCVKQMFPRAMPPSPCADPSQFSLTMFDISGYRRQTLSSRSISC